MNPEEIPIIHRVGDVIGYARLQVGPNEDVEDVARRALRKALEVLNTKEHE